MKVTFKNLYRAQECSADDHAVLENLGWKWNGRALEWRTQSIERALPVMSFAEGDARDRLEAYHAVVKDALEDSYSIEAPPDFTVPAPPGLAYRPYQLRGIKYMYDRADTLLGDDMRLGKTVQTIGLINKVGSRKNLIIPPATLKINWARELCKWLVDPLTISICEGQNIGDPDADTFICNYDIIHNFIDFFLGMAPFGVMVCDESHRLRGDKSRRSKLILGLDDHAPITADRRLFLSGTQLYTRPLDLWTLCQACDPQGLGSSWWKFVHRYCAAKKDFFGHLDIKGESNMEELQRLMRSSFMIRRTKDQVSDDLIPRHISIPLSRKGSEKLLKDEKKLIAGNTERLSTLTGVAEHEVDDLLANYLNDDDVAALTDGEEEAEEHYATVRRKLGVKKIPQAKDFINNLLDTEKKVVVFGYHREVVQKLHELFGDKSVLLIGGMKAADKQASIDRFTADDDCRIFTGNFVAAGEGTPLHVADVIVFVELSGIAAEMNQAERRIDEVGKQRQNTIYYLAVEGSLDESLTFILKKRRETFARGMNIERILS